MSDRPLAAFKAADVWEKACREEQGSWSEGGAMNVDMWRGTSCWWRAARWIHYLFVFSQIKGSVFILATPPDGWSTGTLIKSRPHNETLHFRLLKRSAATFGVCLRCVAEERKPWKEISVQMCLQSLLSVPVPTSQPLFPGLAPSRALHGEQEAGLGARPCCRRAKESGNEASAQEKVATIPTMSQSHTDSHVQETWGKLQSLKSWVPGVTLWKVAPSWPT